MASGVQRGKIGAIIAAVAVTVIALLTHQTESFYPTIPLVTSVTITALCLLLLSSTERVPRRYLVGIALLLGLGIRTVVFWLPGSLFGNDPDKFVLAAHLARLTGSAELPFEGFYSIAAGFHTYLAEILLISTVTPRESAYVFAVTFSITLIFSGLALARRLQGNNPSHKTITAVGIALPILPMSLNYTYLTTAQNLAAILFLVALLPLTIHLTTSDRGTYFGLVILISIGILVSHKAPLAVFFIVVASFWAFEFLLAKISTNQIPRDILISRSEPAWLLGLVLFGLVVIQQAVLTDHAIRGAGYVTALFEANPQEYGQGTLPTAVTIPNQGYLHLTKHYLHAAFLLVAGAISGLLLLVTDWQQRSTRLLLAINGVLAVLTVVMVTGVASGDVIQPNRFYILLEIPLIILIAIGLFRRQESTTRLRQAGAIGLITVLLLTQTIAATALPAYEKSPREYLTDQEADAKEFTLAHSGTQRFATDEFYQREVTDIESIRSKSHPAMVMGKPPTEWIFIQMDGELFNASLDSIDQPILYRHNVEYWYVPSGYPGSTYQLTYDAKGELEVNRSKVYENDDVGIYV